MPKTVKAKSTMKNRNTIFTVLLALASLVLSIAQAVVPPPDGGYPNLNTAEGQNALLSLTTGQWNTALGGFTLWKNTDGSFNTAVGTERSYSTSETKNARGVQNTAVGSGSSIQQHRLEQHRCRRSGAREQHCQL
jgi:hypothetical protein